MAARNETKANAAIGKIAALNEHTQSSGEISWLRLDLDDPREVKKAAEEFMSKEERLDILGECCRHMLRSSLLILSCSE